MTKEEQIQEFLNSDIKVAETIYVNKSIFYKWNTRENKPESCDVISIDGDNIVVKNSSKTTATITKADIISRLEKRNVGQNPFKTEKFNNIRSIAYDLESIVYSLDLLLDKHKIREPYVFNGITASEVNWNPFVYLKNGEKQYYQRDFVWNLEDNQALIDSIYNNVSCGVILIRKRSYTELESQAKAGETELSFRDIVDGKQRLNAIYLFINNKFQDSYGNYYSDLSDSSQHKLLSHQLFQYCELPEKTSDEEVLYQFLKTNFTGKQQSKEHIEYVKSIYDKY